MVTLDRIRLRGLLKENPALCRVFPLLRTEWIPAVCIPGASRSSAHAHLRNRQPAPRAAWLNRSPASALVAGASSERRLLTAEFRMQLNVRELDELTVEYPFVSSS